jgi:rRNA maturation endonuclease Nob1
MADFKTFETRNAQSREKRRPILASCDECGASIDRGEKECPYCGHVLVKVVSDHSVSEVYRVDRESGTVHFGDGITGARPVTDSDGVSAAYRVGGGRKGTLPCSVCKHVNPPTLLRCEACGAELQRRILHRRKHQR